MQHIQKHTKTYMKESEIIAHELSFPIKHPDVMENYIAWMKAWAADLRVHYYYRQIGGRIKDIINKLYPKEWTLES